MPGPFGHEPGGAMTADVQEGPQSACAIPDNEHRSSRYIARQSIARLRHLRGEADQHPFASEDAILFKAINVRIGIPPSWNAPAQRVCRAQFLAHATHSDTGAAASCNG